MTKNSKNQIKNNKLFFIKIITYTIILITIIFTYSLFFYSSEEGLKSVYKASFDWKIDILATISGLYVLSTAIYLFTTKKIKLPSFLILSLIGASQSMMHIAKWIVRNNLVT